MSNVSICQVVHIIWQTTNALTITNTVQYKHENTIGNTYNSISPLATCFSILYPAMLSKVTLLLGYFLTSALAIKVYQSSKIPNPFFPIGLKLIAKSETNFTQGLTICGRFNYELLSKESNLFWIGTSYNDLVIWDQVNATWSPVHGHSAQGMWNRFEVPVQILFQILYWNW